MFDLHEGCFLEAVHSFSLIFQRKSIAILQKVSAFFLSIIIRKSKLMYLLQDTNGVELTSHKEDLHDEDL